MSNKSFSSRPFRKLRKQIEETQAADPPPAPRIRKKDEYTDEDMFSSAMGDVQEIAEFRSLSCERPVSRTLPSSPPRNPDREVLGILAQISSGQRPINLQETQEYVEWINPEYQDNLTQDLHRGVYSVQSFLDLHGFTVPEAEAELEAFLREAFVRGFNCIKIIHGRGLRSPNGPRLKHAIIRRLSGRHRKSIIAFATSPQCDGGLGALYVLLRKKPGA